MRGGEGDGGRGGEERRVREEPDMEGGSSHYLDSVMLMVM